MSIYEFQNANQCSQNLVITEFKKFCIYSGACTAASFGQMLTVIGATVSDFPWLYDHYYPIGTKPLSFLPSQNLFLKMYLLVSKEKYCRVEERDGSLNLLIDWMSDWFLNFLYEFTTSLFWNQCCFNKFPTVLFNWLSLIIAKANLSNVLTYTSLNLAVSCLESSVQFYTQNWRDTEKWKVPIW